jgi:hypothetical protein
LFDAAFELVEDVFCAGWEWPWGDRDDVCGFDVSFQDCQGLPSVSSHVENRRPTEKMARIAGVPNMSR